MARRNMDATCVAVRLRCRTTLSMRNAATAIDLLCATSNRRMNFISDDGDGGRRCRVRRKNGRVHRHIIASGIVASAGAATGANYLNNSINHSELWQCGSLNCDKPKLAPTSSGNGYLAARHAEGAPPKPAPVAWPEPATRICYSSQPLLCDAGTGCHNVRVQIACHE